MSSNVWIKESPVAMVEGEVLPFTVLFEGAESVSSPVSTVFKGGQDYSSEVQLSGDSDLASGNVVSIKKITAKPGDAGSHYIVNVQAVVDSVRTEIRKLKINIVDEKSG